MQRLRAPSLQSTVPHLPCIHKPLHKPLVRYVLLPDAAPVNPRPSRTPLYTKLQRLRARHARRVAPPPALRAQSQNQNIVSLMFPIHPRWAGFTSTFGRLSCLSCDGSGSTLLPLVKSNATAFSWATDSQTSQAAPQLSAPLCDNRAECSCRLSHRRCCCDRTSSSRQESSSKLCPSKTSHS